MREGLVNIAGCGAVPFSVEGHPCNCLTDSKLGMLVTFVRGFVRSLSALLDAKEIV